MTTNATKETKTQPSLGQILGFKVLKPGKPKFCKILVHGLTGSGKTTLVRTLFETQYNILLFAFDNGETTLFKHMKPETVVGIKRGHRFGQLEEMIEKLNEQKHKGATFENYVLVIDNFTTALDRLEKESKEWKIISERATRFVDEIQQLPINIVLMAWSKTTKNKKGEEIMSAPDLIPSVQNSILGFMDQILYLKQDGLVINGAKKLSSKRLLYSDGGDSFVARDRLGVLKNPMEPNLAKVLDLIRGDIEPEPDLEEDDTDLEMTTGDDLPPQASVEPPKAAEKPVKPNSTRGSKAEFTKPTELDMATHLPPEIPGVDPSSDSQMEIN